MRLAFERYRQGFHQEVYNELLALGEAIYGEAQLYEEAFRVMSILMQRVRSNIELLIPRLKALDYQFVDGYWVSYWEKRESTPNSFYTPEQLVKLDKQYRIFRPPLADTPRLFQSLEELVGSLPLSIRSWYEIDPELGGQGREICYNTTRRVSWANLNRPTQRNSSSRLFSLLKAVEKVGYK